MQIILCANRKTCAQFMRSLSSRRRFTRVQLVDNLINNIDCPRQLKGYLVKRCEPHDRNFIDSSLIDSMRAKSTMGLKSFKSAAPREWNSIPRNIRDLSKLFNYFLNLDLNLHVFSVRHS